MKFSIVTPSFGQLAYLQRNVASVADQRGTDLEVEHIIQDGGSKDGTREWIAQRTDLLGVAEADNGMYDAINRGIQKGTGDVFAWLNCDEQYLPGALEKVQLFFNAHPEVDIAAGDTIVVDGNGEYMCHRKAVVPTPGILRLGRLPVQSSSLFFRARTVKGPKAVLFDPQWKAMGDWAWLKELMDGGAELARIPEFLSTFTDTGGNLGMSPTAIREMQQVRGELSQLERASAPLVRGADYARKLMDGYYFQKPYDYAIYDPDPAVASGVSDKRRVHHVAKPTFIWKGHMSGH